MEYTEATTDGIATSTANPEHTLRPEHPEIQAENTPFSLHEDRPGLDRPDQTPRLVFDEMSAEHEYTSAHITCKVRDPPERIATKIVINVKLSKSQTIALQTYIILRFQEGYLKDHFIRADHS